MEKEIVVDCGCGPYVGDRGWEGDREWICINRAIADNVDGTQEARCLLRSVTLKPLTGKIAGERNQGCCR